MIAIALLLVSILVSYLLVLNLAFRMTGWSWLRAVTVASLPFPIFAVFLIGLLAFAAIMDDPAAELGPAEFANLALSAAPLAIISIFVSVLNVGSAWLGVWLAGKERKQGERGSEEPHQ
jgi:hypothetical protein